MPAEVAQGARDIRPRALPGELLAVNPVIGSRICALATATQRDAEQWAAAYPGLLCAGVAVPTAFGHAFSSPWRRPDELRVANRFALWGFRLDEVVEQAESRAQVDDLHERVRAVAAGEMPSVQDSMTRSLVSIRDAIVGAPLWSNLSPLWQNLLSETLTTFRLDAHDLPQALADGDAMPTADQYLERTCGFSAGRVTGWIAAEGLDLLEHLDILLLAAESADRAVRLANELATGERDRANGDINVLDLGLTRADAERRFADCVERCRDLLAPLIADQVRAAVETERHMQFVTSFYQLLDYRHVDGGERPCSSRP